MGGSTVERGGGAVTDHELVEDRLIDTAEHGLPLMEEGDEGAPEGDAGDETFGAVDGVEHPDEFSVFVFVAVFLADDPVGGEFLVDALAHQLFGSAISDSHRGGVVLGFDLEIGVGEVGAQKITAGGGQFGEKGAIGG